MPEATLGKTLKVKFDSGASLKGSDGGKRLSLLECRVQSVRRPKA
ncbi:MAG: hypothetical protein BWY75_00027 [bacterium ADurb.Bin425]|nr:MAG: hypothetical protein BWY75_00027 [bacterium ADurb.Bin425]